MKRLALVAALLLSSGLAFATTGRSTCALQSFKAHNHELLLPSAYSKWIPVKADFKNDAETLTASLRNQIYIEPAAFNSYLESGEWPQQAMIVLEVRRNQDSWPPRTENVVALEVAVKDGPDTWSYYGMSPSHTRHSSLSKTESEKLLVESLPKLKAIIEGQIPVESNFF